MTAPITCDDPMAMADVLADLPAWFLATRRERGASLSTVEAATGIANATLSKFERGVHEISLGKAVRILRWIAHGAGS